MAANSETTSQIKSLRALPRGTVRDYLSLARLDHVTKHVFILPGLILACALRLPDPMTLLVSVPVGLLSAVCIASANYVINEWLDREHDAAHPTKSQRRSVVVALQPAGVYGEYLLFAIAGLILAYLIGTLFFITSVAFLASGILYNVPPVRAKDKPYLDVLMECLNNPIRLLLGWAMVEDGTLPPVSVLAAYWMAGAFLMATKRLGEYRDLAATAGVAVLRQYRRSFRLLHGRKPDGLLLCLRDDVGIPDGHIPGQVQGGIHHRVSVRQRPLRGLPLARDPPRLRRATPGETVPLAPSGRHARRNRHCLHFRHLRRHAVSRFRGHSVLRVDFSAAMKP